MKITNYPIIPKGFKDRNIGCVTMESGDIAIIMPDPHSTLCTLLEFDAQEFLVFAAGIAGYAAVVKGRSEE